MQHDLVASCCRFWSQFSHTLPGGSPCLRRIQPVLGRASPPASGDDACGSPPSPAWSPSSSSAVRRDNSNASASSSNATTCPSSTSLATSPAPRREPRCLRGRQPGLRMDEPARHHQPALRELDGSPRHRAADADRGIRGGHVVLRLVVRHRPLPAVHRNHPPEMAGGSCLGLV